MFLVALNSEGVQVQCEVGNHLNEDRSFTILKGETFEPSDTVTLHDALWTDNLEAIGSVVGEFCFVHYSHDTGNFYFGTDRLGRESLFYYGDGKRVVVSDDFWKLVEYLNIGLSDVDPQSTKEFVGLHYPLFYGTIIKNLCFMPPATYARYSSRSRQISLTQYWDIDYCADSSLSLSDVVEQMDAALDNTFKQIKTLNPQSTYGIGLSGGLDSRLIPHYALKNSMPIRSFIIGESRPHKICLSRDHSSARKIADFYGIHHVEVEWNWDSFQEKMLRDVRNFPMGASQFFITVCNGVPPFDVLLTGASGMIVGAEIPSSIVSLSYDELVMAIVSHCSQIGKHSGFVSKAAKGIRYLIGSSRPIQRNAIDQLRDFFCDSEFGSVMDKFSTFVSAELAKGKSNLDVFQTYFTFFLGSRNKLGAFESLQGLRKAYSIYASEVLDATLKWPPEYLVDRLALRETINLVTPEVAHVKAQDHRPPPGSSSEKKFTTRVSSMAEYIARGSGLNKGTWARRRDYQEFSRGIMRKPNPLFDSLFDLDKMQPVASNNPGLSQKLIKTKVILDLIDCGGYKNFCASPPQLKGALTIWTS